jgi:hypothetical protein
VAGLSMSSPRLFSLIVVPVIAFSLTVAASLWQRRAAAPLPEPSQALPVQPSREAAALPRIEAQTPRAPQSAEASTAPPSPEPTVQGESDPAHTNVPARLMVYPRGGQSTVLATLQNTTGDELDVTVTAVSAKTYLRTVVDVTLQAFERKNLSETGIELALGDQVTLQSSPYRDTTIFAR